MHRSIDDPAARIRAILESGEIVRWCEPRSARGFVAERAPLLVAGGLFCAIGCALILFTKPHWSTAWLVPKIVGGFGVVGTLAGLVVLLAIAVDSVRRKPMFYAVTDRRLLIVTESAIGVLEARSFQASEIAGHRIELRTSAGNCIVVPDPRLPGVVIVLAGVDDWRTAQEAIRSLVRKHDDPATR